MGIRTVSRGVETDHHRNGRISCDSSFKTFLDFRSVVLRGVERFPLPDGEFYYMQDMQSYCPPGKSGFEQQTSEECERLKRIGINGPEDLEIPETIYQQFRDSFKWPASSRPDGLYQLPTYKEKIDDGESIWLYMPETVSLAFEFFIRQRKVLKETMQKYIDDYLVGLEALIGQQVSKGDVQPHWKKAWQHVFRTPAEYSLKFYDEGRHNGTRTTNIVLSLPGRFDEGTVARIQYVPIQSRAQIIKAQ